VGNHKETNESLLVSPDLEDQYADPSSILTFGLKLKIYHIKFLKIRLIYIGLNISKTVWWTWVVKESFWISYHLRIIC